MADDSGGDLAVKKPAAENGRRGGGGRPREKMVPFLDLFRFASPTDKFLIAIACICGLVNGE